MNTLLQINVTANWGSTGKIAEEIGITAQQQGWDSYIAYGRMMNPSKSKLIKIGTSAEVYLHYAAGRFLDAEGMASKFSTKRLIEKIESIQPDIVQLHNIHDHFLNFPELFAFLKRENIPVVWTFHDCWPFTGHCTHFVASNCEKWKSGCENCVLKRRCSLDRSKKNHQIKKALYGDMQSMTIVTVSNWINDLVGESFLASLPRLNIYNGVDVNVFRPFKKNTNNLKPLLLFVSNGWSREKGLYDIYKLGEQLGSGYRILIIGMQPNLIKDAPKGIEILNRTNNVKELVELYNEADVFINPTYADTFPTVNLEALACGTPVITYKTGGSPEAIDERTGVVVEQGDIYQLAEAIKQVLGKGKDFYITACRERVVKCFDKSKCYGKYLELYHNILNKKR